MEEQQDLFSEIMPPAKPKHVERLQQEQEGLPARLFLGTTSWSNEAREDLVYPEGCAAADYIEYYAKVFKGVEIDSTWYCIPTPKAVEGWLRRTTEKFRFTAKVPRMISYVQGLVDCIAEMEEFLYAVEPLGERLGPLLLQFPYVVGGSTRMRTSTAVSFSIAWRNFCLNCPRRIFALPWRCVTVDGCGKCW